MSTHHPLIGLIASFRSFECEHSFRPAGRGRVVALLPDKLILVETIAREEDDEPLHMIVIDIEEPELKFFPSIEAEDSWFDWVMTDRPERVVKLVPKS